MWRTREELQLVLAEYARWYAAGWSDRDISVRIHAKHIKPREPFYKRKAKKP